MKKASSYRTRRRKIQNELEASEYISSSNIFETENLVQKTIYTEIPDETPLNYTPTELQFSSPELAHNWLYWLLFY